MSSDTSLTQVTAWLPRAYNRGHAYRNRLTAWTPSVVGFYAERYGHSDRHVWSERLAKGEIWWNGEPLCGDRALQAGDCLVWHRPPWEEEAVPLLSKEAVVYDDGDLLVLNKPSGLPVLPAGGFLLHTLLAQLEGWVSSGLVAPGSGVPRPVHRLGRFTSGLLVCARRSETRAFLSAQLRESTLNAGRFTHENPCQKIYRTLTQPLPADWQEGQSRRISTPIGLKPHGRLGMIWCHVSDSDPSGLPCLSEMTLLQRRESACLVDVAITTGRPHQIRIHAAAVGAPLCGDPLYNPGGSARPQALPGEGGYQLHAHRLNLVRDKQSPLELVAPLPPLLRTT